MQHVRNVHSDATQSPWTDVPCAVNDVRVAVLDVTRLDFFFEFNKKKKKGHPKSTDNNSTQQPSPKTRRR